MKNINKIKDDIYREIVERTVDGREYSDEELSLLKRALSLI